MSILDVVHNYRSMLKQRGAQSSQQIETAHAQAKQSLQPRLDQAYQDINAKQKDGTKAPLFGLLEGQKLEQIKQAVAEQIGKFADFAKMTTEQLVNWASSLGSQAKSAFLALSSVFKPAVQSVADLAQSAVSKIGNLFAGFVGEAVKGVKDALVQGVSLASSIKVIAEQVTQALDVSRWRALTIMDTEVFRAFNAASTAFFGEDALQVQYMWICQLSIRSCGTCVALHGTIHDLSDDLQDHPNGSCIKVPYIDGVSQPIQTGVEWFARQDASTQRTILGTHRAYDLYASGKASLNDFVGIHQSHEYGNSVYQRSAKELLS